MSDEYTATGGFCKSCREWTWLQGDDDPSVFLEPPFCGGCGEPVDETGSYEIIMEEAGA